MNTDNQSYRENLGEKQMKNKNLYGLLTGVGDYSARNVKNLPNYYMDIAFIKEALITGLKALEENIRILDGGESKGVVQAVNLAKTMASFRSCLKEEDTFIFYFSGHGGNKGIAFSDEDISLQSVLQFVESLPAKNKIVILDCCYSGDFVTSGARQMHFEESVSDFAGRGIAILASSAADEVSRLGPDGKHSAFTGALTTAILYGKGKKRGTLSLEAIQEETKRLMHAWNQQNPEKAQHPIFRSSMGGTIYFPLEPYIPYQRRQIYLETEQYQVVKVKPLSNGKIKRLSAFVILRDRKDPKALSAYTKQIAESMKYAKVYASQASEERLGNAPARAIWCYFGLDEEDIINHLHYAYTIWAGDKEAKELYFRANSNAKEIDGIYTWENKGYQMLKKMQRPTLSDEDYILVNRKLLAAIVSKAEYFIADLQEVSNHTLSIKEMQRRYSSWIQEVKRLYLNLSDFDVPPKHLRQWADEIGNLAGWVVDLSLLLEQYKVEKNEAQIWLIKNTVKKYYEGLSN